MNWRIPFSRFLTCLEDRVILILWICSWDSSKPGLVGFIAAYAIVHTTKKNALLTKKNAAWRWEGRWSRKPKNSAMSFLGKICVKPSGGQPGPSNRAQCWPIFSFILVRWLYPLKICMFYEWLQNGQG